MIKFNKNTFLVIFLDDCFFIIKILKYIIRFIKSVLIIIKFVF